MKKKRIKKLNRGDKDKIYLSKRTPTLIQYYSKLNIKKILNRDIKNLKRELKALDIWYMGEVKK